jgi:hypothetical protein
MSKENAEMKKCKQIPQTDNANVDNPKITKKEQMTQVSCRYQKRKTNLLKRVARTERCTIADVMRTAFDEFITNHNLDK